MYRRSTSWSRAHTEMALATSRLAKAIEHIPELGQHEVCQVTHSAHRLTRHRITIDRTDAFADILRQVADPLQLVCDPQDPDNLPKIVGHRLPSNDDLDGSRLDCPLHGIYGCVGVDHLSCTLVIALAQSCHCLPRICLSASPPISAIIRESSCRSESNAVVVCSARIMRDANQPCIYRAPHAAHAISYDDSMNLG